MSKSLPIVTYPALQLLLLSQLHEVICLRSDVSPQRSLSTTLKTDIELALAREPKLQLALQRVKGKMPVLYRSAIALQLAKPCCQPALTIANAIAEEFVRGFSSQNLSERRAAAAIDLILRNFTVQAEPPGWLCFQLTQGGLAAWLQLLTQAGRPSSQTMPNLVAANFVAQQMLLKASALAKSHVFDAFAVQYAHARCCALLRLTRDSNLRVSNWHHSLQSDDRAAPPIPWLNDQGELRLTQAAEQNLVFTLIDTVDELSGLRAAIASPATEQPQPEWQIKIEKLATLLAQAFLSFYDACRFWGEVQQQDPALVEARLGLVIATQRLLQLMLQEWLGLQAPTEL